MARILVIEDEHDLQRVLGYNLKRAGHEPVTALRGGQGLQLARDQRPDLVLLDLMLPDMPGTDVCRALKQDEGLRAIPVLILTARGEEADRVVGFELGADDYVVKPFSIRELVLRIEALLRRTHATAAGRAALELRDVRIDPSAHRVWVDGAAVDLTLLEFKLLLVLAERRDRVQSREAILDSVWGAHADITVRTVDTYVMRLREKLGVAGRHLQTVRGVGYCFAAQARSEPG